MQINLRKIKEIVVNPAVAAVKLNFGLWQIKSR